MESPYSLFRIALLSLFFLLGSLGPALAQPQNALDCDGVDDFVTVPNASGLIANATSMSLICWVYPRNSAPAYPNFDGFAGLRNELDADFYLLQIAPANTVEGRLRNSAGEVFTVTATGLQLNTWQVIGLVYDGATLSVWINGVMVSSVAASGTITNLTTPLLIGDVRYETTDFFLNGRVDEVSLWRRALSEEEMSCLLAVAANPGDPDIALYFNCDQGTAGGDNTAQTSLLDYVGGNNGTLTGFTLTGAASNYVQGAPFGVSVSDTFCPGGSYQFGDQVLTAPGVYTASLPTGGLCDSTVVLTLTEAVVNTTVVQNANTLIASATGTYQWIDCNNNNAPIAGATNQYYNATANGDYAVIVTQNGCSDTSLCFNVTGIGITEIAGAALRVQGDMVTDVLWIEVLGATSRPNLEVLDPTGRVVLQRTVPGSGRQWLDVSGLTTGMHFLRVTLGGEQRVFRFVKQ